MGSEHLLEKNNNYNTFSLIEMMGSFFKKSDDKPSALPNHWPHPSQEDIDAKPSRIIKLGSDQEFHFHSNFVKTSKYELWNFIPKFLLEEFNPLSKIANCYFLAVAALQVVPQISNTNGYPTVLLPLMFVVIVDGLFAVLEDIARHKADSEANASSAFRFDSTTHEFTEVTWAELNVGDYIRIDSRHLIPADVLVLSVAEKNEPAQGVCYVETKSLDGETNLKIRNAMPNTLALANNHSFLNKIKGEIEMEHPNKVIEQFSGVLDLGTNGRETIQMNHVLLRGCVLRNTDWIIGIVLNTGHDTKIMMSSTETPSKTSNLEARASGEIKKIIMLLILVSLVGCTGELIWLKVNKIKSLWYLRWEPNLGTQWVIQFFYVFLLHGTFIPVSLYVSMSVTRFFQSYFMNNDLEMYYARTDDPAIVRTMTLNEELGQISHIFSDKTGTLTCNIMDFRKCSINGVSYGVGITEIGKAAWKLQGRQIPDDVLEGEAKAKANAVPHVSFYCPTYERDMSANGEQKQHIKHFFKIISICHDVIPEKIEGKIKLSASNPDDEALVCAAAYFGFEFRDRREKLSYVFNRDLNKEETIEILENIEFTSKRKRMSVILRDTDNIIRIYTKGADTVMIDRFANGQDDLLRVTNVHMNQYSVEGLRCLLIGYAEIPFEKFNSWYKLYREACTDLNQIEKKKKGQSNTIEDLQDSIEQNLTLVGCTAIEDRLQDGVPETVAELAKAGINIWVLTGDKEETAINIAVACNLVLPKEYMDQIIINKGTAPDRGSMLHILKSETHRMDEELKSRGVDCKPRALIIDGPSLLTAMADIEPDGCKANLLIFGQKCKAVVGCRVSPDQKREMVNLIKTGVPGVRTLSVGDGANDVAMIQEAHIGVGIKGEEGVQAVNSSDFAIAQFRYLSPLLLKHGRFNYIRMCKLVVFMFYKNIFMSICQHFFAYLNGFSGQKIYAEAGIQMFNLLFTSVPIILLGIADMDVSSKASTIFWTWILNAILEAVFVSYMSPALLVHSQPGTGVFNSYLESGALTLTTVIIIANMKIFFMQARYVSVHFIAIFCSILLWWLVAFAWESIIIFKFDPDWYQIWSHLMKNGSFWMGLLLMITAVGLKDLYLAAVERENSPKPHHIVQEVRGLNLTTASATASGATGLSMLLDSAATAATLKLEPGRHCFNRKYELSPVFGNDSVKDRDATIKATVSHKGLLSL
eukprot:gene3040-5957_t